jgi:hypothetical protein
MPAVAFDVVDEVTPKSFHTGTEGCDDSRSVIEEPMKRIHSYTIGVKLSAISLRDALSSPSVTLLKTSYVPSRCGTVFRHLRL